MDTATIQRRAPLGLLHDKIVPRPYDRNVEVLRVRSFSRRAEDTYLHWNHQSIEFHGRRHLWQRGQHNANRSLTRMAVKELVVVSRQN